MVGNVVQNIVNGGDGNAQAGNSAGSECNMSPGNNGCGGNGGGAMWILTNGNSAVQV